MQDPSRDLGAPIPPPYRHQDLDPWDMLQPAGFGVRAFARVVDLVARTIVTSVCGVFFWALALVFDGGHAQERAAAVNEGSKLPLMLVGVVASVLYHAVSESLGGASVGKWACGLRVTTSSLGRATFGGAIVRNLAFFVDALFFGAVGYSAMSRSARQQRYGDRWGDTVVVRAEGAPDAVRGTTRGLLLWSTVGLLIEGILTTSALFYLYSTL